MQRSLPLAEGQAAPAVPRRDDLGQHRDRRLLGRGAAEVEAERGVQAREGDLVEPVARSRSSRCATVERAPIAPTKPDRKAQRRRDRGHVESLVVGEDADRGAGIERVFVDPRQVFVGQGDDDFAGVGEPLARRHDLPHIADRDREPRCRADAAERRRVLAGAEDDEPRPRGVRQHEGVAEQDALAVGDRASQGSGQVAVGDPTDVRVSAVGVDAADTEIARAVERDGHASAVGRGFESGAGGGIRRRDPIGDHLDGASARESRRMGGVVAEAEGGGTDLTRGEDGQRECDGLGLHAPARDRADHASVASDRHRRAHAARSAAGDPHDRDDGDRLSRFQDREQIACQLEHEVTLVPACFLRATLSCP